MSGSNEVFCCGSIKLILPCLRKCSVGDDDAPLSVYIVLLDERTAK